MRGIALSAVLLVVLTPGVVPQSTDVTECISDYQWTINSLGQNPCLVASYLESACSTQLVTIPKLPSMQHYLGPAFAAANPCLCSTITYSVISACGGCQDRMFANWTTWTLNCPNVYVTQFPKNIPTGVEVPTWAYLDVTLTNNTFDPVSARNSISQQSSTPSRGPSQTSSEQPDPTGSTSSKTSAPSSNNAGPIAGGVVGGIVFLAALGLLLFWFSLRRGGGWRRRSRAQDRVDLSADDMRASPAPMAAEYQGQHSLTTPMSTSQSPFSHASTFSDGLGSPVTSGVYTTFGGRNSADSIPQAKRGYTGAAEI